MIKMIIFDLVGTLYDPEASELFPEVSLTLSLLKNRFSMILVTDLKDGKKKLLDFLRLEKYFDDIIIHSKNNDLFADILSKNKIKPSECLVVGDDVKNEIEIARSLGMKFLIIDRKSTLSGEDTIKNLFEIYFGIVNMSK